MTSQQEQNQGQRDSLRFSGIKYLFGEQLYEKIPLAHIVIIGIGGVGSWSAEALARTGIGKLTLIDLDDICITNTNRQIHTLHSTIGKRKVDVLATRLKDINPDIEISSIPDFITPTNIKEILPHEIHIVIDAIDSLQSKAALAHFCVEEKIPLITIGAAAGKTNPTLIRSGDLSTSVQDNLLKQLKKKLRREYGHPRKGELGIRSIYSMERATTPNERGEPCFKADLKKGKAGTSPQPSCLQGRGSASFVTGSFGFAAASEAIILLKELSLHPIRKSQKT